MVQLLSQPHKEFLTFLDELTEVLSGFVPDFQIHEGRHLLFLSLSVGVILVVAREA
jgi:hypothetical protein